MKRGPSVATFEARAMGSPLRLTTVGLGPAAARRAWAVVQADVERTECALSRWRSDSSLSRLNLAADSDRPMKVDPRLYRALSASVRAQRLTEGRFDPRVIARLEALGEHGPVPLPVTEVQAADGWLLREPRAGTVCIAAAVDTGGIGKGLALRWAADAVAREELGGRGLLIDAGGDLLARGSGPDGAGWRIGIEDPAGATEPMAVVEVVGGAVVTSSTAVRSWETADGRTVHHLIDPSTGEPGGGGLRAVSLAAPDPAWAEVWSKALFLAGPRRIGDEARRRGMAAWWIEPDDTLHLSPAARALTIWTREEAAA